MLKIFETLVMNLFWIFLASIRVKVLTQLANVIIQNFDHIVDLVNLRLVRQLTAFYQNAFFFA